MDGTLVFIETGNTIRNRLITEQVSCLAGFTVVAPPLIADIYIGADNQTPPSTLTRHLTISSSPLRLGNIADQLLYMCSKREKFSADNTAIPFGPYIFFPKESKLQHIAQGTDIPLTDKERQLIRCIYEAPNQRIDRGQLLQIVWQYADSVETHTLETHLYRLRQKLAPYNTPWLITAIGSGEYTLCLAPPGK